MQAINGNKDAINTLSTNLNCDVKSIDNALCSIQNAIGKVGGEVGFSAERVINAVNAGDCNVIKAISDCCCTTQRSIDSVNLNLTQMNADNRLSICQQTNTLQNAITSGFNTLSSENATRFNILGAKIDAQTQIINDKFCQLEMREMQNKIDTLRDEKNALQSSALLQQQTSNIVSQIRPCPVPAYLTCNPYGCIGNLHHTLGQIPNTTFSVDSPSAIVFTLGITRSKIFTVLFLPNGLNTKGYIIASFLIKRNSYRRIRKDNRNRIHLTHHKKV